MIITISIYCYRVFKEKIRSLYSDILFVYLEQYYLPANNPPHTATSGNGLFMHGSK